MYAVDLDADPFIPQGWRVGKHRKMGFLEWSPERVTLYLSDRQQGTGVIPGGDLQAELADKDPYNANLLDFLLAHQELIPEEWKGKSVFFWGTIYYGERGGPRIRCLYWRGNRWDCLYYSIMPGCRWHLRFPSACRQ